MNHPCLSPWKGAVAGGLIAFVWSSVSWMALPFHERTLNALENPAPVVEALAAQAPGSGVYLLMNGRPGEAAPAAPFLFVSYHAAGWGSMGLTMLLGLILQGFGGFWWTWILGKIPGLTMSDAAKYGAMFGLCVGVLGALPNSVWWKFPWGFSLLYVLDAVVAWTIASPVIARWCQASVCALPRK